MSEPAVVATECAWCLGQLDEEEIEDPRKDLDGEAICDECYYEEYMYICPICQNFAETKDNEKHLMVTPELAENQRMEDGIYQVVEFPVYSASMLGHFNFFPSSSKRVARLPVDARGYWQGGFICEGCAKKAIEEDQWLELWHLWVR